MRLNKKLLIGTLVAGVAAGVIDLLLYNALSGTWTQAPLIALLLGILAVVVVGTVLVLSITEGTSDEEFFFLNGRGPIVIALAVALVVLFFGAMGLEAIYDHEATVYSTPTSYIFLLDESGSMDGNDPDLERYKAVNAMMSSLGVDTPYAVYMFASEVVCVRPMDLYSKGAFPQTIDGELDNALGGGTAIRAGLEGIINDYYGGLLANAGAAPRVILLSDGYSGDMRLGGGNQVLQSFRDSGITISCVGLGSDDQALMQRISKKTGGGYVHLDNAQDLAVAFTNAASIRSSRDLYSERDVVSSDVLYAILRVLFLTVLGAIIIVMKAAAWGTCDSHWLIMIVGFIAAFVGALVVELVTLCGGGAAVGLVIYCVLVAVTPAEVFVRNTQYATDVMYTPY